jgi:hypothetical protein
MSGILPSAACGGRLAAAPYGTGNAVRRGERGGPLPRYGKPPFGATTSFLVRKLLARHGRGGHNRS